MKQTLYQILGVRPKDTASNIAAAHEILSSACLARQQQGDQNAANELMRITAAFGILGSAEKRDAYDEKLAAMQFQPRPIAFGQAASPLAGKGGLTAKRRVESASSKLASCRVCDKEISRTAPVCPHCGEVSPVHSPRPAQLTQPGTFLGVLVAFIVTMIFVFVKIGGGGQSTSTTPPAPVIDSAQAQVDCKRYVLRQLKTPSKAEFAPFRETTITGSGDGPWVVKGWVDSQNSFGAMMRTNYACTVSYSGEDVTLQDLQIK